jgi:hypothetical protein
LKNSIQRLQELSARFEFDNQPINDLYQHLNHIYYQLNHEESLYPLTVETQLRSISHVVKDLVNFVRYKTAQ